ncbi:hypothetical protein J6590_079022 [Homalodisca vitripennis]|nr:hypothetical protein J6590_079022 [Homalodisca vitripennis]
MNIAVKFAINYATLIGSLQSDHCLPAVPNQSLSPKSGLIKGGRVVGRSVGGMRAQLRWSASVASVETGADVQSVVCSRIGC